MIEYWLGSIAFSIASIAPFIYEEYKNEKEMEKMRARHNQDHQDLEKIQIEIIKAKIK